MSHDRAFLNDVVTSTLAIEAGGIVHEYAGGYDDYLLQRPRPTPIGLPAPVAAKATRPRCERPPKLTHKEKQELAALPRRIEILEEQRRALHDAMANPAFFRRPGPEIAQDNAKLSALEQELVAAYERWEALEALAD
ncbi:MAG: hypothetical protein ACREHD_22615 [Pirellulales bacterium]